MDRRVDGKPYVGNKRECFVCVVVLRYVCACLVRGDEMYRREDKEVSEYKDYKDRYGLSENPKRRRCVA